MVNTAGIDRAHIFLTGMVSAAAADLREVHANGLVFVCGEADLFHRAIFQRNVLRTDISDAIAGYNRTILVFDLDLAEVIRCIIRRKINLREPLGNVVDPTDDSLFPVRSFRKKGKIGQECLKFPDVSGIKTEATRPATVKLRKGVTAV